MSLEDALNENTKAVLALTYALNQQSKDRPEPGGISSLERKADEANRRANPKGGEHSSSDEARAASQEQSHTASALAAAKKEAEKSKPITDTSPPSESESVAVKYEDVSKLVIAISKESVPKAKAALSRLGVKHGKELKEEQWAEAVAYLTRVVNGTVDPEASHE